MEDYMKKTGKRKHNGSAQTYIRLPILLKEEIVRRAGQVQLSFNDMIVQILLGYHPPIKKEPT